MSLWFVSASGPSGWVGGTFVEADDDQAAIEKTRALEETDADEWIAVPVDDEDRDRVPAEARARLVRDPSELERLVGELVLFSSGP